MSVFLNLNFCFFVSKMQRALRVCVFSKTVSAFFIFTCTLPKRDIKSVYYPIRVFECSKWLSKTVLSCKTAHWSVVHLHLKRSKSRKFSTFSTIKMTTTINAIIIKLISHSVKKECIVMLAHTKYSDLFLLLLYSFPY